MYIYNKFCFFSNVFIGAFILKNYFENEQFITVHPAFWRLPDCPSWKFQAGQDDGWSLFDLSNANVYYLSTISSSFLPKWDEVIFEIVILFVKVARWKKRLFIILNIQQNLNFLFLSLCVYLFVNCFWVTGSQPSQCFVVRSSVFFLTKNKTKARSSFLGGKIQILLYVENYTYAFLPPSHLYESAISETIIFLHELISCENAGTS